MALSIRLARGGAKKRPYYRIVVTDSRNSRDGRFIEKVGTYDPMKPKDDAGRVVLETEKIQAWLAKGAQPTDRVLRFLDAELGKGRQAYVVYPLVEESEALQARAATVEAERLRTTEFREHTVELIHGQMPSKQKSEAMRLFADREAQVLVAVGRRPRTEGWGLESLMLDMAELARQAAFARFGQAAVLHHDEDFQAALVHHAADL